MNRPLTLLLLAACAATLTGCPMAGTWKGSAPRSARLATPRALTAEGDVHHAGAGLTFPPTAAGFTRSAQHQYDQDGHDLSVGYDLVAPNWRMFVTIYVYPGPEHTYIGATDAALRATQARYVSGEMARVQAEILGTHTDAALLRQGPSALFPESPETGGVMAVFTDRMSTVFGPQDTLSEAHLALWASQWFLKVRATYPPQMEQAARQHLQQLVRRLTAAPAST